MAKRVEMVRCFRPTHATGNASKNVNECSFMERIVLLSFNGPVLCHMIAPNAVLKTESSIADRAHERISLNSFRPRAKDVLQLITTTLWQNHRPHQIFCALNQRTHQSLFMLKRSEELCLGGTKLSKSAESLFSESTTHRELSHSGGACNSFTPSLKPLLPAGTLSRDASPEMRQTWRWRARETAAVSGQCGTRPHQSARDSCFRESP